MPSDPIARLRRAAAVATGRVRLRRRPADPTPPDLKVSAKGLELLMSTALFDQPWVEQQLGRKFESRRDAVAAYLRKRDCSPHPLFFHEAIDPRFGRPPAKRDPLLWYLNHIWVRRNASPHPLIDIDVLLERHPELGDEGVVPLEAWLATATDESVLPSPAGIPPTTLGSLRSTTRASLKRWRGDNARRHAPRASPNPPPAYDVPPRGIARDGADPLVSVVMPLWNRATVVRTAIESVQAQSLPSWELIVVDDGSTDDSVAVVTGIAAFDDRIRLVQSEHGGVSAARNTAIEQARGPYVAFLDTDNRWLPDFLHVMTTELGGHPDWAMAHAALRARRDGDTYYRAFEGSYEDLLVGNHIDLNVLVARTDVVRDVGAFDPTLRRGVDYDLVLRLARSHPPHLVPYVGVDYTDDGSDTAAPRISTSESLTWLSVIASRHLVDWDEVRATPRDEDLISVVLAAPPGVRATARWMRAAAAAGERVEIVVVGTRLPRWQHVVLETTAAATGNTRLVTLQVDRGLATAANVGLAATRGSRIVLIDGVVEPDIDAALRLADALGPAPSDPAVVQPLVVGPTGSIWTAGAGFDVTVRPYALLEDHATVDLDGRPAMPVPAVDGPVVAFWAQHIAQLDGLDPMADALSETDLSLRCIAAGFGGATLLPDIRFVARTKREVEPTRLLEAHRTVDSRLPAPPPGSTEVWEAAGFEVLGHRYHVAPGQSAGPDDQPLLLPLPVIRPRRLGVAEAPPVLRWAIDLASPVGERGRAWGDTHYGEALAAALRRRGQHVAVDARETRHRSSRDYDDVILVLRGLDRVAPRPGCVNLEWIISHPDLVTADELAGFDGVYAASHSWSERVTEEWGVEVRPLLQATDPSLFHAGRAEFDTGAEVLFVGNSRGIFRSSLRHATAAGIDVTVHGQGWSSMLPADWVASRLVDNRDLGALYTAAGVVLNDHWEDMRLTGFVSNRLMDAAASGARVASDEIPGLDLTGLFGGLVQTWRDEHDLARIVRERDTLFPSGEERLRAAEKVAAEHSFDARAEVLLDHAVRLVRR